MQEKQVDISAIIRDATGAIIGLAIIFTWLYCLVTGNPAATQLSLVADGIIGFWLVLDKSIKLNQGRVNGRYIRKDNNVSIRSDTQSSSDLSG